MHFWKVIALLAASAPPALSQPLPTCIVPCLLTVPFHLGCSSPVDVSCLCSNDEGKEWQQAVAECNANRRNQANVNDGNDTDSDDDDDRACEENEFQDKVKLEDFCRTIGKAEEGASEIMGGLEKLLGIGESDRATGNGTVFQNGEENGGTSGGKVKGALVGALVGVVLDLLWR